jgi:hypothetical protein
MPRYINPNTFPVSITILEPRTCVLVYPEAWPRSRVPANGLHSIELDALLARPLVSVGMLKLAVMVETAAAPDEVPVVFSVPEKLVESTPGEPPVQIQVRPETLAPVAPVESVKPEAIIEPSKPAKRRRFHVPAEE